MMRPFVILVILVTEMISCKNLNSEKKYFETSTHVYPTVSYLDIKLDSFGRLPSNPYVLKFEKGNKKIIFCGTMHLPDHTDTDNPMFAEIEKQFFSFQPTVCVNEGGDLSNKQYESKEKALLLDGEIGLTKILADSLRIKTINGDPPVDIEFSELLKRYSKGEFLAYIVTERFMWSIKGQSLNDIIEIEKQFQAFIQNYIMKKGKVELTDTEQSLQFYKDNYEKLLNRSFTLDELEPTNPFEPKSKFQEIGRASKEIRDQFLLKQIDSLIETNDKVFVVFGGWHLLTCKPGLEQIIDRQRY